jgi:hypothetical protein
LSVELLQLVLIVHCKEYAVHSVPVKVVVGLDASSKLPPVPLMIVHAPVPCSASGVLAARVAVKVPSVSVWLLPAIAIVG